MPILEEEDKESIERSGRNVIPTRSMLNRSEEKVDIIGYSSRTGIRRKAKVDVDMELRLLCCLKTVYGD